MGSVRGLRWYVYVRMSVCMCSAVLLCSSVSGVCIVSYCFPVRGVPKRPLHIVANLYHGLKSPESAEEIITTFPD